MRSYLFIALAATARIVSAITASSMSECPALAPRVSPPTSVDSLRIDDIKVVGALGDSIMAGLAMEGLGDSPTLMLNITAMHENRGHSWAMGGDDGAITFATMLKHHNPHVMGLSTGRHIPRICKGIHCMNFRTPGEDVLNAAMTGATAVNLDSELDYLIPQLKEVKGLDYQNDWKLITIQIGSNDQCSSCSALDAEDATVEKYGYYVDKAVARIKEEVPRVVVNLVGTFKVSPIYNLTKGQDYCKPMFYQPNWLINRFECACFLKSEDQILAMDALTDGYNTQLQSIAKKYNAEKNSTFAVAFQPININLAGFPMEALSNVDCFHPSRITHQWVAKIVWNNLFVEPAHKIYDFDFDANLQVYCPTEIDRIRF
ncbi:hypothetical protein BX666DRAFT_2148143 [Dichotomocladium elegans]|nr:hypothetical protein BX666DRAFT_2148143 [Dichotomocladium elegans]